MKRLLILLAICLMTACSKPATQPDNQPACNPPENQPAEQPEPQPQPQPEPEPEPTTTRGKLEDPDAPEQTRALALIEQVTGMKFKVRPPVYVYTPEELAEEVKSWGGSFVPDNILGFYKFDTKAFYLVPEAAGNKRAFGLRIHEATHALQDQYYDLPKLHAVPTTTDGDYALLALIEGEAVQVMIDALIEEQPHVAFISKARAPEGSTDAGAYRSVYVYAQGTAFVQALKEVDGYKAVDAAFKDLPVSSEQVLHPEKYTGEKREMPDRIEPDLAALKAALPEGYELGKPDTLGEFETRLVFVQQEATVADSEKIAAGWGGDWMIEATKGEQKLSLWITTWDTAEDAKEFWTALLDLPDLRQAQWDENSDPRKVIVVRGSEGHSAEEVAALIDALGQAKVSWHDGK
ncbi:MAG: hypothetical protein ICCCNLDF_03276 [Planctomycetes bacterium]|nr:hypothetical protein [Planctomycetota bacterium]